MQISLDWKPIFHNRFSIADNAVLPVRGAHTFRILEMKQRERPVAKICVGASDRRYAIL